MTEKIINWCGKKLLVKTDVCPDCQANGKSDCPTCYGVGSIVVSEREVKT